MAFELPALPYEKNALEPHISQETLEYHYGKHHNTYVTKLNGLIEGTDNANKSLEDIIKSASGPLFNNAAQVWNHTFYWHCLSPNGGGEPTGAAKEAIEKAFGSFEDFKKEFNDKAANNFGSGWTWLATQIPRESVVPIHCDRLPTGTVTMSFVPSTRTSLTTGCSWSSWLVTNWPITRTPRLSRPSWKTT